MGVGLLFLNNIISFFFQYTRHIYSFDFHPSTIASLQAKPAARPETGKIYADRF